MRGKKLDCTARCLAWAGVLFVALYMLWKLSYAALM